MPDYLLDTNIIRFWYDTERYEHASVIAKLHALRTSPRRPEGEPALYVSLVSIGEIEFGHRVQSAALTEVQARFLAFIEQQLPQMLEITRHTTACYGDLRARLFEKYAPRQKRAKGLRPEQLTDPLTAKALGIQENDLWIAAQAIERNLVLATHDRMARLRQVATELRIEDWTDNAA